MKEQFNHSATKDTIKSLFTAGRSEKLGVAESLDGPTLNQLMQLNGILKKKKVFSD